MSYPTTARTSRTVVVSEVLGQFAGIGLDPLLNEFNADLDAITQKLGINSSAVTTTVDFKLSGVPAGGKAASLTGTETLTNKTLTAPKMANNDAFTAKDSGGTDRTVFKADLNNILQLGDDNLKGVNFRNGCFLKLPSAQAIPTAASTDLLFGASSEAFDPLAMHSTASNMARIVLPATGVYELSGMVIWADSTSGAYRIAGFFINGSGTSYVSGRASKDSGGRASNTLYAVYNGTVGDYITLQAQQDTGSNLNVTLAFFSAKLIGV